MLVFVNAKINLGLNVINRRPDGYHDLQTVFYPVGRFNGTPENPSPFCDILEIVPKIQDTIDNDSFQDHFSFHWKGRQIDCPPEKNLVVKAAKCFYNAIRTKNNSIPRYDFDIILDKQLPDGAGLGGGSADASFTLRALNNLYGDPFSQEELITMAASLGADCPFFILNRPVFATGIGEVMTPVDLNLSGYWCVIVKDPGICVSTADAFRGIKPAMPEMDIREIIKLPVDDWQTKLHNDFEFTIFAKYPGIAEIKERLLREGAVYAAMSGSGASVFGLFSDRQAAENAVNSFSPYFSRYLSKL